MPNRYFNIYHAQSLILIIKLRLKAPFVNFVVYFHIVFVHLSTNENFFNLKFLVCSYKFYYFNQDLHIKRHRFNCVVILAAYCIYVTTRSTQYISISLLHRFYSSRQIAIRLRFKASLIPSRHQITPFPEQTRFITVAK